MSTYRSSMLQHSTSTLSLPPLAQPQPRLSSAATLSHPLPQQQHCCACALQLKSHFQWLRPSSTWRRVPLLAQFLALVSIAGAIVLLQHHRRRRRKRKLEKQHRETLQEYATKFGTSVRFGLDIGGTLCKLVYFEPDEVDDSLRSSKAKVDAFIKGSTEYGVTGNRDNRLQFHHQSIRGTLHFLKFQTSMMSNFVRIVQTHDLNPMSRSILLHQSPSMQPQQSQSHSVFSYDHVTSNHASAATTDAQRRSDSGGAAESSSPQTDNLSVLLPHSSSASSCTPRHLQHLRSSSASVLAFSSASTSLSTMSTTTSAATAGSTTTVRLHAYDPMHSTRGTSANSNSNHDNSHSITHHAAQSNSQSHAPITQSSHHAQTFLAHLNDESCSTMSASGVSTQFAPPQQQTSTVLSSSESMQTTTAQQQQQHSLPQSQSQQQQQQHQRQSSGNSSIPSIPETETSSNSFPLMSGAGNPSSSLVSSSSPSLLSHQSESCTSRLSSQSSQIEEVSHTHPTESHNDTHLSDDEHSMPEQDNARSATAATSSRCPFDDQAPLSQSDNLNAIESPASIHARCHRSNSIRSTSGANSAHHATTNSTTAASASPHSAASSSSAPAPSWLAAFPATCPPFCPPVCATGGGAYKFEELFKSQLGVELFITDELESLVRGIDFLIHQQPDEECYYLSQFRFRLPLIEANYGSVQYPYLVVNIGSGVSILKVCGPNSFERVGGTSLGGGTFYGLCRALCGCTSFEEALEMAEQGHSQRVDLLVGDIYGGDYAQLGLSADNIASSFGKLVRSDALQQANKHDLAKALLIMITNNIGSLANLYAHKVLHIPQIIFVGNFLTHNDIAKRGLAFATDYWSHQTAKALFLRHEGYFGAVGSMLFE